VNLFEGGDEGEIVEFTVFVGEGLTGAEFFEQVIHPGDGDVGVVGLHSFAMGIEPIATYIQSLVKSSGLWKITLKRVRDFQII
jgi:hypothetical protein